MIIYTVYTPIADVARECLREMVEKGEVSSFTETGSGATRTFWIEPRFESVQAQITAFFDGMNRVYYELERRSAG